MIILCILKWLVAAILSIGGFATVVVLVGTLIGKGVEGLSGLEKNHPVADKVTGVIFISGILLLSLLGLAILVYGLTTNTYTYLFDCDECTPEWLVPACGIDTKARDEALEEACALACEGAWKLEEGKCWCETAIELEVESFQER